MYVTGIGRTAFGKLQDTLSDLAYKSTMNALKDADLEIKDIDAVYVSNFCAGPTQHQLHLNALVADTLKIWGKPIIRIETACASGGSTLHQALFSLAQYHNVLVLGFEKLSQDPSSSTAGISMASDRLHDQLNGLIFPAAYALIANQYMSKYGLTLDDLSAISFKNHAHANLNTLAHFYRKTVSLEDINASQVISSPLRLFDCSPLSDGGCALVVSAKKRNKRDIKIVASALSTGPLSITHMKDLTTFSSALKSAKDAYKQAGIKPPDVNIACVHDCFTIAEVIAMEDLGLYPVGKAKEGIRNRDTWFTGKIPINTDGGLKADGHPIGASGLAQIFELVVQLRGEAGERQIEQNNIGLAHNIGGIGGTAAIHILSKS